MYLIGHLALFHFLKFAAKCEAKLEGGSRSIRSLDEVYANEGLTAGSPPAPGELRHPNTTGTLEFAERIHEPHVIPRNHGDSRDQTAKNTGRHPAEILPGK